MPTKPWGLSVYVIIRDDAGRLLLLKRSLKSKSNPGKWEPPGGKTNQAESFDNALIREVGEETGLKISILHVAGVSESELPNVKVIRLVLDGQLEGGQLGLSEEHDDYVWVFPQKLASMELADWFRSFAENYVIKPCSHGKAGDNSK